MLLECVRKGDLRKLFAARGPLEERAASHVLFQVLHGLAHLHARDVIHRDVKLENLLLADAAVVKLCDFGWCSPPGDPHRSGLCGTFEYMAPEVVKRLAYSHKVDVWAVGVLAFELVHGYSPFHAATPEAIVAKIEAGDFQLRAAVSERYRGFVHQCLHYFAGERPACSELLHHELFRDIRGCYYRLPTSGRLKEPTVWNKLIVRRSRFDSPESPQQDREMLEQFAEYQGRPLKPDDSDELPEELQELARYEPARLEIDFEDRGDFSLKNIGDFIDFDIDFSAPLNFLKDATTSFIGLFGRDPPAADPEPPARLDPEFETACEGDQQKGRGCPLLDLQEVPDETAESSTANKVYRSPLSSPLADPLEHAEALTASHPGEPAQPSPDSPRGFFSGVASFFGFGERPAH